MALIMVLCIQIKQIVEIAKMKIQELVDRHNSIIRNFENRLLSMQRLVSEQEMTLHNAQAALDEARNEIARLKR